MQAATGMFSGMPASQIRDLLRRALHLAEADGDKQKMAIVYNKLGYLRAAAGLGDFERIEADYQQGVALARMIGDQRTEEIVLSNLGVLFTQMGEYDRARETLATCLALAEEHPTYWRHLVTQHYLGALHMQMGQLDRAREKLVHASEQLASSGNHHFEVKARSDLGLLYHLIDEDLQAQTEFEALLRLITGHGDLRFEALVSTRLGYVLEALGRMPEAIERYAHGHALHTQMGQFAYAHNALAGLARIAALQGEATTALSHAQTIWQALDQQPLESTVESTRTLRTCYTIFRSQENAPCAAAVRTRAINQLERRVATIDDPAEVEQFWALEDHRFFRNA